VIGDNLPGDMQAVAPGVDLGEGVIGERVLEEREVGTKDILIGKVHGLKAIA
jgi:hypothetical protein